MNYQSFFTGELKILFRRKQSVLNALVFFLMVVTLFPLGVNPSADFLSPAAGGIIWCAASLAILMATESVFKEDFNDGSLEQWVVSGLSLSLLVAIKVFVHWLGVILPLLMIMPVLAQMLFISADVLWVTLLSLLLGSPALFLIGSIGAALTVSLRHGAVLMLLIIIPFYLPIIIFATGAIRAAQVGMAYDGQLAVLVAITLLSLALAPVMSAVSLKASIQ